MAIVNGTATLGTSGVVSVAVGIAPIAVQVVVTSKSGETYSHQSIGFADNSGYATYHSTFQDTTGGKSMQGSGNLGKIVSIYERVAGTITEVLSVNFHSFNGTNVKFTVNTPNANYTCNLVVWS